jgi:peptidyl-prolyl cis-trans isomerase D
MAFIGTLRNKLTKVVVGFVFVAMAAFIVGSDLLGSGPRSFFGGQDNVVGEIGGKEISLEEFQAAQQEIENNYALNMNRRPTENEMPAIRNQAWDLLVARNSVIPEYARVGVVVGEDELLDMIQGKNVDEGIKNSFKDSLGRFDRTQLNNFLVNMKGLPKGHPNRIQWDVYQSNLAPARERLKYEALLLKTNYVTQAEAEREYHAQTDVAEVKYLYVPFYAVSDSTVTITDAELKSYYEKNKEKYKSEQTRSLSYVTFPVVASSADSATIKKGLEDLVEGFKTTTEDSLFALNNSSSENAFKTYNVSNLPENFANQLDDLKPGVVLGPFQESGFYKLVKMVKIGTDTASYVRASNILITWDDPSDAGKKKAKDKARQVLNEIRNGASFANKAFELNNDATKNKGGDLGWFTKGAMVKPFEKAAFAATKKGLINDIIETTYGYHIIEVTGLKNNTTYTVAVIEDEITPSDATRNEAYRKADAFAAGLSGVSEFQAKAKQNNLSVFEAKNLGTSDRRINNLGDARGLITWLFRDGSIGKVSDVQDVNDTYVVGVMTGEVKKGYKPLDLIKEELTPLAKNEVKAKQIIEKLKGKTDDLETLAQLYGRDALVNSASDLKFSSNSMVSVGFDPIAVGRAFSLESGKRSEPFKGENGVLVIEMKNKTVAPAAADYMTYKTQLTQSGASRSSYTISEALKDAAKIEDKRYKFF